MATPIADSVGKPINLEYTLEAPDRMRVTINGRFFGSVYRPSLRAPDRGANTYVDFGLAIIDPNGTGQVESVFMTLSGESYKNDIALMARYMESATR